MDYSVAVHSAGGAVLLRSSIRQFYPEQRISAWEGRGEQTVKAGSPRNNCEIDLSPLLCECFQLVANAMPFGLTLDKGVRVRLANANVTSSTHGRSPGCLDLISHLFDSALLQSPIYQELTHHWAQSHDCYVHAGRGHLPTLEQGKEYVEIALYIQQVVPKPHGTLRVDVACSVTFLACGA